MAPPASPRFLIDGATAIGHVHLRVADLRGALAFYGDLLGLHPLGPPRGEALHLSPDGRPPPLLALTPVEAPIPLVEAGPPERRAGLYHFALLLPHRRSLATAVAHLLAHRERVVIEGAADHGVSESLYIADPEGNGIEVTCDRPPGAWPRFGPQVRMVTAALDLKGLLREADPAGWRGPPPGTAVGHVHLHVPDLEAARRFYVEALGLRHTCTYPGALFFAAGGYHHHVATNVWRGEGIAPAPEAGPGIDHFALRLPNREALGALAEHLARVGVTPRPFPEAGAEASFVVRDPAGIAVQLMVA